VILNADRFAGNLNRLFPRAEFWIAYSGGLDSTALLHLCVRGTDVERKKRFRAVHVNHGLHPYSGDWARHCIAVCAGLGVDCRVLKLALAAKPGRSLEEVARTARYQVLLELMTAGAVVLTAHHRDDQAETILLQLLRGSGLKGLSGMPESVAFGPGTLHRPLLRFSRRWIHAYAEDHGLNWIDDPSNADTVHARNYLRHEIIPRLKKCWPGMDKTITRSGTHCADAQQIIDDLVESWLDSVLVPERQSIPVAKLSEFDEPRQRLILRHWIRRAGFRMPNDRKLQEIVREASEAAPDRSPSMRWENAEVRRYRGELYLLSALGRFDRDQVIPWPIRTPLSIPDLGGVLECRMVEASGHSFELPALTAHVRFRTGGERCRLPGRNGTHSLKKIFQELAVPPWARDRVPLVYLDEELAAIGGLVVCEPFRRLGLECDWHRQNTT
jgi:tRNA(Ile)-lysidine synthase